MTKRFHLPIVATQREPSVGEGARSLSRWAVLKQALANDPTLLDELRRAPEVVMARFQIAATKEDVQIFLAPFASLTDS
jgi:hypothetical protein